MNGLVLANRKNTEFNPQNTVLSVDRHIPMTNPLSFDCQLRFSYHSPSNIHRYSTNPQNLSCCPAAADDLS